MIQVESAITGETFQLRIEPSIDKLKYELSLLHSIPPSDQIILYGPPYKPLDQQYDPSVPYALEGKRAFLFDKRIFQDVLFPPTKVKLSPNTIPEFSDEGLEHYTNLEELSQPELEGKLKKYLERSQICENFVLAVLSSCIKNLQRQKNQADAVNAAIENLNDHFSTISKEYNSLHDELTKQLTNYRMLIDTFEDSFSKLALVEIDQALIDFRFKDDVEAQNRPKTLLDCIPIEKEKIFYGQSKDNFQKISDLFEKVDSSFKGVEDRVLGLKSPHLSLDIMEAKLDCLQSKFEQQKMVTSALRNEYQYLYQAEFSVSYDIDASIGSIAKRIRAHFNSVPFDQKEIVKEAANVKSFFELSYDEISSNVFARLREIALIQHDIQFTIKKKDLESMKRLTNSRNNYFDHLNSIKNLPSFYTEFIKEICRRRKYNKVFENELQSFSDRITSIRLHEIDHRKAFMENIGIHLPPIFREFVPTLKNNPPYVSYEVTDFQELPVITGEFEEPSSSKDQPKEVLKVNEVDLLESGVNKLELENQSLREEMTKLESLVSSLKTEISSLREDTRIIRVDEVEEILHSFNLLINADSIEHVPMPTLEDLSVCNIATPSLYDTRSSVGEYCRSSLCSIRNFIVETKNKHPQISFSNLKVGDIALFMPANVNNRRIWMAFSAGKSRYKFLAEDSLEAFMSKSKSKEERVSILGKIIFMESKIAESDENEYNIPKGTEYQVCYAEPLVKSSRKGISIANASC